MFKPFISKKIENKILCLADFNKLLVQPEKKAITFVNPFSYQLLANQPKLIDDIDVLFSDGALLCAFSNLRRKNKIDRVSFDFSSIADIVFTHASDEQLSVALLGGSREEISQTVMYLENRYPRLNICFSRDGYFDRTEFPNVISDLDLKGSDIVIAGMGTPLQDEFIVKVKELSKGVKLSFTCGGFLTQTASKGDYYSPVIKKLGLRWLQRCILHKHVRTRLIKNYPVFIFSYLFNIKFDS